MLNNIGGNFENSKTQKKFNIASINVEIETNPTIDLFKSI